MNYAAMTRQSEGPTQISLAARYRWLGCHDVEDVEDVHHVLVKRAGGNAWQQARRRVCKGSLYRSLADKEAGSKCLEAAALQ